MAPAGSLPETVEYQAGASYNFARRNPSKNQEDKEKATLLADAPQPVSERTRLDS